MGMEVDRNRLTDIELTENAVAVLKKRYLKKNDKGEPIEEPIEMFRRVAANIAEGEFRFKEGDEAQRLYELSKEKFLQIMLSRKFMPNSPTLMNAGRELQQLSACFVLPVEDSIDGIYDTLKHQAIIHKSGGGTGFGFSRLRPKNDLVKSTMGVSSGPVSFMAIYDASTDKIKQGGTRRGANMGILRVDHPDIEEFITCKNDNDQINNFNISVAITDAFMEAVEGDTSFDLVNPRDGEVVETVRARDLFYRDEAGDVDWEDLRETVHTAIRFLDNVIEVNSYPLPEIDEMSRGNRRIGLGVMVFADLLIKLGITYDSEEGLAFAERVMKFVDDEAWEASRALAEERGVMPHYEGSRHEARGDRVRNATVTTIAPTGTISIIAGCSGGVEPLFAVAFMRRQADMELPDVNPEFVKLARERGFYSEDLMKKVAEHGSVRDIPEVPEDVRSVWVTSHDITPEWHVRMQAAFQKHTSMGISKTINLPSEATPKDVEDAYRLAYSLDCKAMAVYRDGSRDAQVLSTGKTQAQTLPTNPGEVEVIKHVSLAEARNGRPRTLSGVTKKMQTGHGPMYVTMNDDEFGPRECFIILGKPGGTAAAFSDALGRMISLAMTHGAQPAEIVHQLRGIQDGHPAGVGPNAVLSVPDGVARAMAEHYLVGESLPDTRELPIIGACPDCGSGLTRQEGCVVCHSCGYSKCS